MRPRDARLRDGMMEEVRHRLRAGDSPEDIRDTYRDNMAVIEALGCPGRAATLWVIGYCDALCRLPDHLVDRHRSV